MPGPEAIYLVCGAGRPQLKRNRLGGAKGRNVDRCWAALLLVIPAASCVETQAPLALGPEYVLTAVNGSPLPFAVDSVRSLNGNFDYRIVGRSIKFLSADCAQYEEASDLVEPLPDGTFNLLATGCFGVRTVYVAYRSFLVVTIDSNIFHPPTPVAIHYDTLTPSGDTLIYRLVQSTRVLRLAFVPGRPATPVCAPFVAPPNQRLKLSARGSGLEGNGSILSAAAVGRSLSATR